MENASKALLIAAAVLIVLLLIGLGMWAFNTAKGSMSGADLSSYETQTFNDTFTNYGGDMTGSQLNGLVNAIVTMNGKDTTEEKIDLYLCTSANRGGDQKSFIWKDIAISSDTSTEGSGSGAGGSTGSTTKKSSYPTFIRTAHGNVSFDYNSKSGRINKIYISDVTDKEYTL